MDDRTDATGIALTAYQQHIFGRDHDYLREPALQRGERIYMTRGSLS